MKSGLLLFVILSFGACTNTTKIPEGIIAKPKMEVVLWDLIQADRFSTLFLLKDSSTKAIDLENIKLYQRVLQIHKISKEDFIKSYKFYLSRPDISKVIFDSIAVKAERQREKIYNVDTAKKVLAIPVN